MLFTEERVKPIQRKGYHYSRSHVNSIQNDRVILPYTEGDAEKSYNPFKGHDGGREKKNKP